MGEGGGTGNFTVNITEPITLIPYCRMQPRIINSRPAADVTYFGRGENISITFAGPMKADTLKYDIDLIQIFMRTVRDGIVLDDETPIYGVEDAYYLDPSYDAGSRTLAIFPVEKNGVKGPPARNQITLFLGTGISTFSGGSWVGPRTLVWQTRQNRCSVANWIARYDESKRQILISWEQVGDAAATLRYKNTRVFLVIWTER